MISAWCRWWRGKVMVGTVITSASSPFVLIHVNLPGWMLVAIAMVIIGFGMGTDMIAETVLSERRSSQGNQIL